MKSDKVLAMSIAIILISGSVAHQTPWYVSIPLYAIASLLISYALRD